MSAYPSSTCATDSSANDFPPLPSTFHSSSTQATTANHTSLLSAINTAYITGQTQASTPPSSTSGTQHPLAAQRIATWLNNPTDGQPQYTHTSMATSIPAHTQEIASYLKTFDDTMTME